jgi:benzoate-CoA ligase family protein
MNICVPFLDAHIAEGRGHRTAIQADDRAFTYADVVGFSARCAARLAADDVKPGERVLLALPDGVEIVGALFGVLRRGAVAVMANPDLSADLLRFLADDTGATAVFVSAERAAECRTWVEGGARRRIYSSGDSAHQTSPAHAERVEVFASGPDDDAIWQFSSGTTGRPKAVRHSHRAFTVASEAYGAGVLGLTENDVTLAVPKLFFGYAAGANLLFPFAVGASCILFPGRSTADALFERIRRHRPTVLVNTPAMIRQMVSHPEAVRQDLSCLRVTTSAGEALPTRLQERWTESFQTELLDGFGMTEMCHIFISNRLGEVTRGAIGRVLPGYDVRLCDVRGHDVSTGETGELWVRGDSRANGYWQRPDENARVFRGDWCVAGDMLCRNGDGTFAYRGRVDDMLKVNGRWVAPRAVEDCLLAHPRVHDAAVVGVMDADGLVRPRAFVVAVDPGSDLAEELRDFVRARLEPHAHPRDVVFLDALPRTAQGKVDRRALQS